MKNRKVWKIRQGWAKGYRLERMVNSIEQPTKGDK